MVDHRIQWVPDELMAGQDFILCNQPDEVVLYMNKRVRLMSDEENAGVWEEAWRLRRLALAGDIPQQRRMYAVS